jgi:hypothetical protein
VVSSKHSRLRCGWPRASRVAGGFHRWPVDALRGWPGAGGLRVAVETERGVGRPAGPGAGRAAAAGAAATLVVWPVGVDAPVDSMVSPGVAGVAARPRLRFLEPGFGLDEQRENVHTRRRIPPEHETEPCHTPIMITRGNQATTQCSATCSRHHGRGRAAGSPTIRRAPVLLVRDCQLSASSSVDSRRGHPHRCRQFADLQRLRGHGDRAAGGIVGARRSRGRALVDHRGASATAGPAKVTTVHSASLIRGTVTSVLMDAEQRRPRPTTRVPPSPGRPVARRDTRRQRHACPQEPP